MSTSDKSGPPPGLLRRAWNFAMELLDVLIRPSSVFGLGVLVLAGFAAGVVLVAGAVIANKYRGTKKQ